MSGSRSLRFPLVTATWCNFDCDIPDPADVTGFLVQYARRFPYPELFAAIPLIRVWHPQAPGFPGDLGGAAHVGGRTDPANLNIRLVGTFDVHDVLAHELGHVAQHFYGLLPGGTEIGNLLYQAFAGLPGPDDEEAFANAFGAFLLGGDNPFMRWFPKAIDAMRPTVGHNSDCFAYQGTIRWTVTDPAGLASGSHMINADGRHLAYDGTTWKDKP